MVCWETWSPGKKKKKKSRRRRKYKNQKKRKKKGGVVLREELVVRPDLSSFARVQLPVVCTCVAACVCIVQEPTMEYR